MKKGVLLIELYFLRLRNIFFLFILFLYFPFQVFAEIKVIDEQGLTRAYHFTTGTASVRFKVESKETNNIHVKMVNLDGLAADIETIYYESEILIPGIEQGTWRISLRPQSAIIVYVKLEEDLDQSGEQ